MFNKWTRSYAGRYRQGIKFVLPEAGGEWQAAKKLKDRHAVAGPSPFCAIILLNVSHSKFQNVTIEGTKQGLIDCQPSV